MQVVAGPRQVGKTTLVGQAVERLNMPVRYASADEPTLRGWLRNRRLVRRGVAGSVLREQAAVRVRHVDAAALDERVLDTRDGW